REDPAGTYARQDFPTKDRYRQTVEKLARGSRFEELQVARLAVDLARPDHHVGYYLIGRGRSELETRLHFRPGLGEWLRALVLDHPGVVYFGSLFAVMSLLLAGALAYGWSSLENPG